MKHGNAALNAPRKSLRLDSGFASAEKSGARPMTSGTAPTSFTYFPIFSRFPTANSQPPSNFMPPAFASTNWDRGAAAMHLHYKSLRLKQPVGFPIVPLPSTVKRWREEVEMENEADFEIYEEEEEEEEDVGGQEKDAGDGVYEDEDEDDTLPLTDITATTIYEKDDYEDTEGEDEVQTLVKTSDSDAYEDAYEDSENTIVFKSSSSVVDSHGRTRAASKLLKSDITTESLSSSSAAVEHVKSGGRERRLGRVQAAKQPKRSRKMV